MEKEFTTSSVWTSFCSLTCEFRLLRDKPCAVPSALDQQFEGIPVALPFQSLTRNQALAELQSVATNEIEVLESDGHGVFVFEHRSETLQALHFGCDRPKGAP